MSLVHDVPADFPAALGKQLPPDGQTRLRVFGDLTLDGQFGPCVLSADSRRLYFGSPSGEGEAVSSLELGDVRDVRLEGYLSSGAVVADRADDSVVVARFTMSQADLFESAGRALRELTGGGAAAGEGPDGSRARSPLAPFVRKAPRCPKCGRALSPRAEVCIYCADKRRLVIRLAGLLWPHWPIALVSMLTTLATTGLSLLPPVLTKPLVDKAILPRNTHLFAMLLIAYVGASLLANVLNGVRMNLMGWLGQRIIYDLRQAAFARLQELSLRYYESRQTGRLINRITADTERIERFVVESFQELVVDVVTLTAITVILFYNDWRLAVVTILPTPLIGVLVWWFSRRLHTTYRKAWRTAAAITAHLADVIPGVRVVKGFAREADETERFERRSRRLMDHNVRLFRMRSTFFPVIAMFSQVGYVMLWAVGGYLAMRQFADNPQLLTHASAKGTDTVLGTLILFSMLLWRFYDPINRLSRLSDQVQRATTSAERVFELLDAFPEVSEPAQPRTLGGRARGRVEFRNISFAYEPGAAVLRDVDLTIEPGEMVGIVGQSGVGKSTLASLLLRFYDPDAGQVLLDGVDLRELSSRELRGHIGLVLQEPLLFHGSVADNIRYGQPDATAEQVIDAARAANAHNFLMRLPEGYDALAGERGVRLSQGEKQRISIARAVLRDPPILILDEATASVDTETERLIQLALDRLIRGRTVLAIAHRLSTLRHADRIIVLADGRIAEMGSHDELTARRGLYFELCRAQSMLGQDITPSPPRPPERFVPPETGEPPAEGQSEEVEPDAV